MLNKIKLIWFRLQLFFRKETPKSEVRIHLESIGFYMADKKTTDYLFDTKFFERISKEDQLIGVVSKRFKFNESLEESEYSGTVVVGIIKLPTSSNFLEYKVKDRPCYSGEIIWREREAPVDELSFRGSLTESSLDSLCAAINNENYWSSLMQARALLSRQIKDKTATI